MRKILEASTETDKSNNYDGIVKTGGSIVASRTIICSRSESKIESVALSGKHSEELRR